MKKVLLSTIAATALWASAAHAADMARRPVAPVVIPPPLFTWTGFYLGANIGAGWGDLDASVPFAAGTFSVGQTAFIGGGQAGYNWQTGAFVLGVEWDFDWTDASKTSGIVTVNGVGLQATGDWDWTTTIAARLGYAVDRWLWYAKVGAGWNKNSVTIATPGNVVFATGSHTSSGWLIGGGLEYAFTNNWTGKIEYTYLGLSDYNFPATVAGVATTVNVSPNIQTLKFGVNYKF